MHGIYALRQQGETLINRLMPEPYAALLNGMLLGIESGIPDALYDQFNLTGTSHVIVISGRNEIIVRTTPDYEYGGILWDAILSDLPTEPKPFAQELQQEAFFAMDTLWLKTEYLAGCPDCLCRGKMEESQ
jgi:hypothetical protein